MRLKLLFLLYICFFMSSAKNVSYSYDNVGNRVKREIIVGKISAPSKSYDVWGMLRDSETHEGPTSGFKVVPFLSRGYAGHEHWASLRLINMNARLYDPDVRRFLSYSCRIF